MKKTIAIALVLVVAVALSACQLQSDTSNPDPETLTVLTHASYDVGEAVVQEFEEENNAKVEFIKIDGVGTIVNTLLLNQDNLIADVVFGIDNTFLQQALDKNLFAPHASSEVAQVREAFKIETYQGRVTPIDFGDVCSNYDIGWFVENNIEPPTTTEQLSQEPYKGLVAVPDPTLSSPGLAFLVGSIHLFGEEGAETYWQSLFDNDVVIADGWSSVYYSEFSQSGGERPIVLSYATSPAAEVYFSEGAYEKPPTAMIGDGCFRQIEYAGIINGTPREALAGKWIDFMLSKSYQEDIPLKMWVYPVRAGVTMPSVFSQFALESESSAQLPVDIVSEYAEVGLKMYERLVEEAI